MAEESPEREPEETSRREFPGLVTPSAAGCRVYIPPTKDDKEDCPGRIPKDDGTFKAKFTICQESALTMGAGEEIAATGNADADESGLRERMADGCEGMVPPIQVMVGPSSFPVTSTPDSKTHLHAITRSQPELASTPDFSLETDRTPDVSNSVLNIPTAPTGPNTDPVETRVVVLEDKFGCDTCVVDEICQMIEGLPKPWSAYRAFEAATARFPNIDRAALRLTTMAVLMGQRRCINRRTNAGMQSGPRRDENGAIDLELNNACADEYRNSY